MSEQLALKYRPTTFDDLVGQRAVTVPLRQMVTTNRVPTAILFKGSRGAGKTTALRILSAALNCDTPPGPCGHCVPCKSVFEGTSMDLVEMDAASNGLVDDIRALRQQVLYSVGGRYRIIGLDEAHSCSAAAFNVMLKMIEEPPPQTVFVLLTTEPGRIPDTVISRCTPFTFGRISVNDITDRLHHIAAAEHAHLEPALLRLLAERADGAMRDAVMALDQMIRADITTVAAFHDLLGETDYGPTLMGAITTGNAAIAFAALADIMNRTGDAHTIADVLIKTLRDVLVLRCGGDITAQGQALTDRQHLADTLETTTVVAAMTVLWDLRTKVRIGDDTRTTLDLAIVMLVEKFTKTVTPAPVRKLTLADMAAIGT